MATGPGWHLELSAETTTSGCPRCVRCDQSFKNIHFFSYTLSEMKYVQRCCTTSALFTPLLHVLLELSARPGGLLLQRGCRACTQWDQLGTAILHSMCTNQSPCMCTPRMWYCVPLSTGLAGRTSTLYSTGKACFDREPSETSAWQAASHHACYLPE